jgi:26S proteasome regulatory subunit N3
LGGGLSDKERQLFTYSNPTKVVRRWLGTASGASGKATSAEIGSAAKKLLDPKAEGRTLLLSVCDDDDDNNTTTTTMEIEEDSSGEESKKYLGKASSREVEAWLLSLQVRIFWKDGKFMDAMDLVQKSISIALVHLDFDAEYATASSGAPSPSLFPLLARLYRYRSLLADALKDPAITSSLRQEMARAHNMACLRRDFDSQATLLNQMLRDLLQHSQSKSLDEFR